MPRAASRRRGGFDEGSATTKYPWRPGRYRLERTLQTCRIVRARRCEPIGLSAERHEVEHETEHAPGSSQGREQ